MWCAWWHSYARLLPTKHGTNAELIHSTDGARLSARASGWLALRASFFEVDLRTNAHTETPTKWFTVGAHTHTLAHTHAHHMWQYNKKRHMHDISCRWLIVLFYCTFKSAQIGSAVPRGCGRYYLHALVPQSTNKLAPKRRAMAAITEILSEWLRYEYEQRVVTCCCCCCCCLHFCCYCCMLYISCCCCCCHCCCCYWLCCQVFFWLCFRQRRQQQWERWRFK